MVRCPCCGRVCELAAQEQLAAADAAYVRRRMPAGRVIGRARDPAWAHWACDECLAAGRALAADVMRQAGCFDEAWAAYLPVVRVCRECRADFTVTPERQRRWHEVHGRYLGKVPTRCGVCGPRHGLRVRAQKALTAALVKLDGRDPLALLRVAELYGEMGLAAKAEEFVRRACNQAERLDRGAEIAGRVTALRERLAS